MRIAVLALALIFALPAAAQPAAPSAEFLAREVGVPLETIAADARAVNACLEAALEREAMQACARLAADPCYAQDGSETTLGLWRCARRLRAAWAPALEAVRARLRGEEIDGPFDRSEAAWEAWEREWCGLAEARYAGGSHAKVALSHCYAHADIDQVIALRLFELSY
jgi:Lysozyme inhibitor LprI